MAVNEKVLWCVKNGDLLELQALLVDNTIHIDDIALTNNTRPAIICAADYGQTEIIKYLVKKGADVNIKDEYGITPLLAAIWEGHANAVNLLLSEGANKNLKSPGNKSYVDEAPNEAIKKLLK